ncbi:GNAT family N-acetyltransferase [Gammaproteobacteria bacterium 42_54_T18]|nr:GNAT family N-acetyltransferase [Gammaproteobacteria bacterium 42_54_T18]
MSATSDEQYKVRFIDSITDVDVKQWSAVAKVGSEKQIQYPFVQYGFLRALEVTGVTTRKTGWQPHHLTVYSQGELVAFLPLYLKFHSYGEYVFDWSWAEAYERHGVEYYPKLLSCIPYTPSAGPRLCVKQGEAEAEISSLVMKSLLSCAEQLRLSSIHVLFPQQKFHCQLQESGLSSRVGTQFHWFNQGYESFDDFLGTFASRKRKNVRKERKKVEQHNLTIKVHEGEDIDDTLWEHFFHFYQRTYLKRSGHGGYLNQAFFKAVAKEMPHQLVMMVAYENERPIAAALNFKDSDTLYGRYWGCEKELDFLHFETCYYQGIEYCIEQGLSRFDPGAQGEHKISRGFTPIETWSNHWIAHPQFKAAIDDFLLQEREGSQQYIQQCKELLPFKAECIKPVIKKSSDDD